MERDRAAAPSPAMTWSARQYTAFEAQRTRPVRDLVCAIATTNVTRAIDLGCGPGNSTEVLRERYPDAAITGLDSALDMLASARKRMPDVTFVQGDIAHWSPEHRYDVILANASLQWLPDHATLYPRLLGYVGEGGTLAVQTPDNEHEPAHVLMRKVAAEGPWSGKVEQARALTRHAPPFYYELLKPLARNVDVWRTVYYHPLASHDGIVEWFKGTALRPYLDALDAGEKSEFLARYRRELEAGYPALRDGTVMLPFPRVFVVAMR